VKLTKGPDNLSLRVFIGKSDFTRGFFFCSLDAAFLFIGSAYVFFIETVEAQQRQWQRVTEIRCNEEC